MSHYSLYPLVLISALSLSAQRPFIKKNQALTPTLTKEQIEIIGTKIWYNEAQANVELLTFWKEGEDWPSLGIGHFIWLPEKSTAPFKETFPELLDFLKKHKIVLPAWLEKARKQGCPWQTRDDFMRQHTSKRMKELRTLLANTVNVQTLFIMHRFNTTLKKAIEKLDEQKKKHAKQQLQRLFETLNGVYAVVDYINFKGVGTDPREAYHGKQWGLLQILDSMVGTKKGMPALVEFVQVAKATLAERVAHSPQERNEKRWLPGWYNRLDTYLKPL
jgi:hypothetical protein